MLRLRESIIVKSVGDEGIIVDMEKGQYISLNQTALEMIEAMGKSVDRKEVILRLLDLMDVGRDTLENDLNALCDRLIELDLVVDQ